MSSSLQFTFVGLPFRGGTDLQRASQYQRLITDLGTQLGPVLRNIMIPQLKVGTLDSLVDASDDLARIDPSMESTVFRLAALIEDLSGVPRAKATELHLAGQTQEVSAEHYLKEFESFGWNTSQFDTKDGISGLVQKFQQVLSSSEERCRGLLNEYNDARTKLQNFSRRTQGNLASVPIKDHVDAWCKRLGTPGPVDTEFLTTLFVAVPINESADFMKEYSHYHDFVVPFSAATIATDSEFNLHAIVCFKKVVDDVKTKCRNRRYAVRELLSADDLTPDAVFKLKEKVAHDKGRLSVILSQQYTQCFTTWVHLKCVRLYVESVLKFGVPVRFIPALIAADSQKEEETIQALQRIYSDFLPQQNPGSTGLANENASISEEVTAARNAKLVSFSGGDNGTLQTDGGFVILKASNVLKTR